jgi:uncharacterized protein YjdB
MESIRNRQIDWRPLRLITSAQVAGAFLSRLVVILTIPILLGGLLQACGGGGGSSAPLTNLKSIAIDPVNSSIAVGTKVQLHATGTFNNKTTKDITASVTWNSADTTVAIVSNLAATKGLAGGSGVGATTVSATLDGITGVSAFTVTKTTLTSMTVEPVNPLVAKGTTVQMAAQGNFSDGSEQDLTTQVSWSSGNNSIAQVSNTADPIGLVTGVSTGNTPITATFNGVQGSTTVSVTAATLTSITVTPPDSSIAKGTKVQLTATCDFSDSTAENCTSLVNWTSSDSGIAHVGKTSPTKGLATGVGVGSTAISASLGGIQGSATVTVTATTLTSITITPPDPSIARATAVRLTATGIFSDKSAEDLTNQVSWTSADDGIAEVGNDPGTEGLVTGLGVGDTSITAMLDGVEGSTTVTVTGATLTAIAIAPPKPSIANGTAMQLTATGIFSDQTTEDLTSQVSWTSADNAIAEVSDIADTRGLVTGVSGGNTSITATLDSVQGSTTVTVTVATLTAITITPPDPFIAKGTTVRLTATGTFTDGTTEDLTGQVFWTSNDESIQQVDNGKLNGGLVTGLGVGSATTTATLNGIQGSTTVTVTAATLTSIVVTPPDPSMAKGTTVQLTATGNFSDESTEDLTSQVSWTSGDNGIAQVSDVPGTQGLVTGLAVGNTPITANLNGIQGSAALAVTAATLTSIVITPPDPSVADGTTVQLTATGDFSDGTTEDLTDEVSWTSSNGTIAQVSDVPNTQGLVTALAVGNTSITATLDGIQRSTTVTVTAAVLTSITIKPPNLSIAMGTKGSLTATGIFSDGTTEDLTAQVFWTSSDGTIASVGNVDSLGRQVIVGLGVGSASIAATLDGVHGSTTVIVFAKIISIDITPPKPSIAKGTSLQLTATAKLSDGTTEDLTDSVSWSVSPTNLATVDATGLLTGVEVGSGKIITRFKQGGSTFFTFNNLKVTAAVATAIQITPPGPSIAKSTSLQLTAMLIISDGTTEDLRKLASWSVSPPRPSQPWTPTACSPERTSERE